MFCYDSVVKSGLGNAEPAMVSAGRRLADGRLTFGINDGGFFLGCEDFGKLFDDSFPACAFSLSLSLSPVSYTHLTLPTTAEV